MGAATYQLIKNLVSPVKPTEKSFEELMKLVKDHHHPLKLSNASISTHAIASRVSIEEFVAQLRNSQSIAALEILWTVCCKTGLLVAEMTIACNVSCWLRII